jgi:hypothetical protein
MNKLTREECEQACLYLFGHCYEIEREVNRITFTPVGQHEANIFKLLIEEHFDNPPLKFEDLKEGMWVWDNSVYEKNYSQVKKVFRLGTDFVVSMEKDECEDGDEYLGRAFEENRFFRREVIDEKIQ